MSPKLPICNNVRFTTTSGAVKAAPGRVLAVVMTAKSATDEYSVELHNTVAMDGTPLMILKIPAAASSYMVDMTSVGGLAFDTVIYAKVPNVDASAVVFYV